MPSTTPATSMSAVRRQADPKTAPPSPLATLDLSQPGELSVHDFLLRAASGPSPLFRVLTMRRRGSVLLVAIESAQGSPFVLTLWLERQSMSLRSCRGHEEARRSVETSHPSVAEFGCLLRERREAASLTREKLAGLTKLSIGTIRGLERAWVTVPCRSTLEALLCVGELGLTPEDLPHVRRVRAPRVGGGT